MRETATMTPRDVDTRIAELTQATARQEAIIERATQTLELDDCLAHYRRRAREDLEEAQRVLAPLQEELDELTAEYKRRPWTRAWLVLNHDGHYHRATWCQTTFPTTRFGWAPELADLDDDELVEAVGHMACTVCYPDAPRHPRYIATLEAAEAAKTDGVCPGSGRPVYGEGDFGPPENYAANRVYRYARCPDCRQGVTVTRGHKLRKHKVKGEA